MQLIAFIIRDSIFARNYLSVFDIEATSLYFHNCTFSNEALTSMLGAAKSASLRQGIPKEVAEQMFQDYLLTQEQRIQPNSYSIFKPTSKELATKQVLNPSYSVINLLDSDNHWGGSQSSAHSFYTKIQHGNLTGIDRIFTGFKMGNQTLAASNQFINCSFFDFPMTIYAQSILSFAKNKVYMSNIKFYNIQTRVIDSQIRTQLIIEDSDISEIGTHIMYHLEDVAANSFLAHF